MKRIAILLLFCAAIQTLAQSPYSSLQVPKVISYQGRVTQNGAAWSPGTGEGYFVFALVQNGSVLWNNYDGNANPSDPASVGLGVDQMLPLPVSGGQFSVRLGDTGTSGKNREIPATVFFDANSNSIRNAVKLAVWFSADANTFTRLAPDVDLASVPYALVAGIAETVQDRAITTAKVLDGAVTTQKLAPAGSGAAQLVLSGSYIAGGAITNSQLADGNVSSSKLASGAVTLGKIASGAVSEENLVPGVGVPVGTILPYSGATAPPGYLLCNGDSYPRTQYPALATVLSTGLSGGGQAVFGGSASNFNVPDLAGMFLRGVDYKNSVDPDRNVRTAMTTGGNSGNAVGSVQTDEFKLHDHITQAKGAFSGYYVTDDPGMLVNWSGAGGQNFGGKATPDSSIRTSDAGGSETRPKNAYVNYIIKY